MANDNLAKIEAKALRMVQIADETRRLEEEKELIKDSLGELMKEEGMGEYRVSLDEFYDAKVKAGEDSKWKLDEEGLAEHLDMSVSAVKDREVLIKATERNALSLDDYKRHFYLHTESKTSVRRVKAL